MWSETLDLDRVGIHDHFQDLGGYSLAAIQLVSRVLHRFHADVRMRSLFGSPTVADMAFNN
jgi:hypothetical protein